MRVCVYFVNYHASHAMYVLEIFQFVNGKGSFPPVIVMLHVLLLLTSFNSIDHFLIVFEFTMIMIFIVKIVEWVLGFSI